MCLLLSVPKTVFFDYRSNKMDNTFNNLSRTTLRHRLSGHKRLEFALVLVWSCDPMYVITLFESVFKENLERAQVVVFFQRWNYPPDVVKEGADKKKCRTSYQKLVETERNTHAYGKQFLFFKCHQRREDKFQIHTKSLVLVFDNGDVEYVQLSWNLGQDVDGVESLVYKGFPKDTELLTNVTQNNQLFISRFTALFEDTPNPEPVCRSVHLAVLAFKNQRSNGVDHRSTLVVSVPSFFNLDEPGYRPLQRRVKSILSKTVSEHKLYHYNKYVTDESPSVLVTLYSFVDARLLDKVCDVVGRVFTSPDEENTGKPETFAVTVAYPETFNDNQRRLHEKFVYRVANLDRKRVVWLFFCSHNLTLPSWQAYSTGAEEGAWKVSGDAKQNLDVGVFMFSEQSGSPYQRVHDYLLKYYYQERDTFVKFHQSSCQRRPATAVNKRRPTNLKTVVPTKEAPPSGGENCASRTPDAWQRFKERRTCLLESLLPKVVGMKELLDLPEFRRDNYTRFALYDHVFNHLAADIPWKRQGNYNVGVLRYQFDRAARNEVWYNSTRRHLVVETLVDVYLTWGKCFELFDSQILLLRPSVSNLTVVDYSQILWSRSDNRFLVDPKRIASKLDRHESVSPYDTLSFLVQHMFENYEVWWQCPVVKEHNFYWDVQSMFTHPRCVVCNTSPEVRLVYETIAQLNVTKYLTVEFPIFKRETGQRQDKLIDDYVSRGFPDIQGIQLEPRNELLCYGTPHDNQRLMNMRYDVFYVVDDKAVAIELDDSSHRLLKEQGKLNEAEFSEPVRKRHNADAVKNVISWLMNVHLVRIATASNDALATIPSLVVQVSNWVTGSHVHVHENLAALHNHVKQVKASVPDTTRYKGRSFETVYARTLQNPVITAGNTIRVLPNKPISCVLNTDTFSTRLSRDTLHLYVSRGKLHVVNQEQTLGVPICLYVDVFSLFYNFTSIKMFQSSRQPSDKESWFSINNVSRVGTLYDSTEHGGTHVVVSHPVDETEPVVSFDITKVARWERECETTPRLTATDAWYRQLRGTHLADPVQFVRLFERFRPTVPTDQERQRFKNGARGVMVDPLHLEEWIKARRDIYVSKEDDFNLSKKVRVTSVKYDERGRPTIRFKDVYNPEAGYFTRPTVLPGEIVNRVRGPHGERSRYVPME